MTRPRRLSKAEWKMETSLQDVPDWQWLAMLNYEYARCNKPILKAVKELRDAANTLGTPSQTSIQEMPAAFAKYLAAVFPEFPKTPWSVIDKNARLKRLADSGINDKNGLYTPRRDAWKAWTLNKEALSQIQRIQSILPEPFTDTYGVFEIDFLQKNPKIIKQFSSWLMRQRKALQEKHNAPQKLKDGSILNTNLIYFERKSPPLPKGRGHKKRQCQDRLVALGWCRLWQFTKKNVSEIDRVIRQDGKADPTGDYYPDEQLFYRASATVAKTMGQLEVGWAHYMRTYDLFEDPFIIEHDITGVIDYQQMRKKKSDPETANEWRERVKRNFSTEALGSRR